MPKTQTSAKPSKANRQKFGLSGKPIPATRVLQRELEHDFGKPSFAIIAIDDKAGTFTAANVYGGDLGRNYDADSMTHPLPAEDSDKWKEWKKRGYEEGNVEDFDVLTLVGTPATANV